MHGVSVLPAVPEVLLIHHQVASPVKSCAPAQNVQLSRILCCCKQCSKKLSTPCHLLELSIMHARPNSPARCPWMLLEYNFGFKHFYCLPLGARLGLVVYGLDLATMSAAFYVQPLVKPLQFTDVLWHYS